MNQGEERPEPLEVQLLATARVVRRAYDSSLSSKGFNMTESGALQFLAIDGSMSQRELADRLHIGRAATGACIESLESRGHVRRSRNGRDGRVWEVSLTERGAEAARTCSETSERVRDTLRNGISREDQRRTASLLSRVRSNALAELEEP